MSRYIKKSVLLMTSIMFFLSMVLCIPLAKAENIDNNAFAKKIKELKNTFKDGEYWNYYSASDYSHSGTKSCNCVNYCAGDCSCKCGQFYYNGTWYGGQCHGYALKLGNLVFGGNPAGWGTHSDANNIVAGDIVRAKFTSAGLHTIFVYKVDGSTVYYTDCNFVGPCKIRWEGTYSKSTIGSKGSLTIYHASNNKCTTGMVDPEPDPMSKGYDCVLPEGDYIIAACADPLYFLDIEGGTKPAANNTNVQLYKVNSLDSIGDVDVWTITYNSSDKFYTIKQKGTDMCLDVEGNGKADDANVQVYPSSGDPDTHKWAISISANDAKGYRLQAKSSGYYLDMSNGLGSGMNVRQHHDSDSNDERWVFIPYKPFQPISKDRYIMVSALDESYIMDVEGDTGNIANNTNVRLWADTANNQYNCFDVIPLANGYYKFVHTASGKALDLRGGSTDNRRSISLYDDNGSAAQQWAIKKNGSGYTIWARCSGKVIDMEGWEAKNGVDIFQYFYTGGAIQTWKFVKAEHRVMYDATEGTGAPSEQIKYYKTNLKLSETVPKRKGYKFVGWENVLSGTVYQPGDVYTRDSSLVLYALWERNEYTIYYDPSGGDTPAFEQTKPDGETVSLSTEVPTWKGYAFLGWATSPSATSAEYQPGDSYSENKNLNLYAVWAIANPPKLTASDEVMMIVGDRRDWADFVTLEHDGILSYTMSATISECCSIKGDQILADTTGTAKLKVTVNEYPAASCTVSIRVIDLSRKVKLPEELVEVGDKAFSNTKLSAVVIPGGCVSIGARAFANVKSLVYIYIPESVSSIASDAFSGSKNVTIYCESGSTAEQFATTNGIRYFARTKDWIQASMLPAGAVVTDNKWTYKKTVIETTTSTKTSLNGYVQTGYSWQQTGNGTWTFADYPGGFDKDDALYSKYEKTPLTSSETETTKREVSGKAFKSYIYWHWAHVKNTWGNKYVQDHKGSDGTNDYRYFYAEESKKDYGRTQPSNGYTDSECWCCDDGALTGGSWWWFRFEVYQQSYVDYEKLFTYSRPVVTDEESASEVSDGEGISEVQHWVKYSF